MRVAFTDMYGGYQNDLPYNPITKYFLDNKHIIVAANDDPDLIVASVFGKEHTKYPEPYKILWAGENVGEKSIWRQQLSYQDVDWLVTSNYPEILNLPSQIKSYYVPYAGIHYDMDVIQALHEKNKAKPKTKFCCFVSSGAGDGDGYALRNNFFNLVSTKYKKVDSAGKIGNNIGYYAPRGEAYFDWVAEYKFMICFENSSGAGYITEKVFTPYAAGTIPIYWGDNANYDLLRREAIIPYSNPLETLTKIIALDKLPQRYEEVLNEDLLYEEANKRHLLSRNRLIEVYDTIMDEIKS